MISRRALVLDDDRTTVFVQAKRIDASTMDFAGCELGCPETHAQQRCQIRGEQNLQRPFNLRELAGISSALEGPTRKSLKSATLVFRTICRG